jgi:phytoene dehydrogenase-like protein
MSPAKEHEAIIVGAGPNGLAAAVVLAQAGHSVLVIEANDTIGGGARSAQLTLPGYVHDTCSAIHPMAVGTHFLPTLPLSDHGLDWIHPGAPLAHPLDDGTAVTLERSVKETASGLGPDRMAYEKLMRPLVSDWKYLSQDLMGPLGIPRHPLRAARFGLRALRPATALARAWFTGERAKALFAGVAAHSILPLENRPSAAVGLVLSIVGHAAGWPFPRGGAQKIADALASYFQSLGGRILTGTPVRSLGQLPPSRVVLFDITPRQLLEIAGDRLGGAYKRQLRRYRYGPGAFKLDIALDGPIPWTSPECLRAGTVHVGGTLEEIAAAEAAVWKGDHAEHPFVLLAQQSLFDPSRAPQGKHTVWAYCHVPNGSPRDMAEPIIRQIERFAPGFRDRILRVNKLFPRDFQKLNGNYIGGDVNGGVQDLWQLFARPALRLVPYTTPARDLFLCSCSTPPGGGVHGLCGYFAAQAAMNRVLGSGARPSTAPKTPAPGENATV